MADLNVETLPMSRKQIRAFVRQIRMALGIDAVLHVDIAWLLEFALPKVVPGFVYDVRGRDEMGNNHGHAQPDHRVMALREDIYDGALDGRGRDRHTVVHEIAHLFLHTSDRLVHRRADGPAKAFRDPEWQAKAFAGEFLVPAHLVGNFRSVSEVAENFGVSQQAAATQLRAYVKEGLIKKGQIIDLAL